MTRHFAYAPIHLRARELLDIQDGEGLLVTCLGGAVWITQANDRRDIVIEAGESFVLDRPGLALVAAPAGAADVSVQAATPLSLLAGLDTSAPDRLRSVA